MNVQSLNQALYFERVTSRQDVRIMIKWDVESIDGEPKPSLYEYRMEINKEGELFLTRKMVEKHDLSYCNPVTENKFYEFLLSFFHQYLNKALPNDVQPHWEVSFDLDTQISHLEKLSHQLEPRPLYTFD